MRGYISYEDVFDDNASAIKAAIALGADVNQPVAPADGGYALTPLQLAARGGNLEICRQLVEAGADVNQVMYCRALNSPTAFMRSDTPMSLASQRNALEIVRYLESVGGALQAPKPQAPYRHPVLGKLDDVAAEAIAAMDVRAAKEALDAGAWYGFSRIEGVVALWAACRQNSLEMVSFLVEQGVDVNAKDDDRWTALHFAVADADAAVVKALVDAGSQLEALTALEWTPLIIAVERGDVDVAKVLIDAGADVEVRVGEYVDAGADVEVRVGEYDDPLIMIAINNNKPEMVRLLIQAGANLEAVDTSEGRTALVQAGCVGNPEVVKMLIDAGANKDALSDIGESALSLALQYQKYDAAKVVLDAGVSKAVLNTIDTSTQYRRPLEWAIRYRNQQLVERLIAGGTDVHALDDDGNNIALSWAALCGNIQAMDALVEAGAVFDKDRAAEMLTDAVCGGHGDMVRCLVACGANPLVKDDEGQTLLHKASRADVSDDERMGVFRALVDAGVNPYDEDKEGYMASDKVWAIIEERTVVIPEKKRGGRGR